MQKSNHDWEGFKNEISGVRFEEDQAFVASRSKDYFWYSPILSEVFENKTGDMVVIPSNQEEVIKVANNLQKKIHPDVNRGINTERLSQLVNEAKEKILKNL